MIFHYYNKNPVSFMVSKELIMGTIKKMFSSGVDDETVRNTLKDIGLSDSEISAYIAEAKGTKPVQASPSKSAQENVMQQERQELKEEPEESEAASSGEEASSDEESDEDYADDDYGEVESSSGMEERIRADVQDTRDVHELGHSATHLALEDHSETLDEIQKKIDALSSKLDLAPSLPTDTIKKINSLDAKVTSIEKELMEVKALSNALQDILKKVLDTDRQVLNKLEKK
jgi:hypothetical protein